MAEVETQTQGSTSAPAFRLDVPLHDLLMNPAGRPRLLPPPPANEGEKLPDPVFPLHPELLTSEPLPQDAHGAPDNPYKRHWTASQIYHTMQGWMFPYVRSRVLPGQFHPIIAYLFTEWKCNLDCHYCWAFDNRVKGMTEDVARRSIDWLHGTTCRVLALMGGEPLLRPDFVHKVVYYAAKKGFWIYVPTNARLLRPDVIDRLADAGAATFNFAVDALDERPGLQKALNPVRKHFDYLVKKQYRYGYSVFFNMNICRNNMEDIKALTEIAHDNGIATDYHINESPMMEQPHFKHLERNETFLTEEDWPRVDELVDWLIEKNKAGYKMANSAKRLNEMRDFMRGKVQSWNCRAGQNSMIIRVDGTLAPCFPMYGATYDWGTVGDHKFDVKQLNEMKQTCQTHCFSTLNHNLGYCYDDARVIKWLLKQAANGFQGSTGGFED
jgi:MoaA/NifB/PqqE/SkfB family radical SAM enzyme